MQSKNHHIHRQPYVHACNYSDPGISEKRKETKIFIERFFSHIKKLKASKWWKKNRYLTASEIKSCHKHLQKHKSTGNNKSICMGYTSFMTSKSKNQRRNKICSVNVYGTPCTGMHDLCARKKRRKASVAQANTKVRFHTISQACEPPLTCQHFISN